MVAGYGIPTLIGALPYYFSSFFLFFLLTGRLYYGEARAETVTSFRPYDLDRPTEQRVHLSTERVCLPTCLPIDRSNDDRPYVAFGRLHRTAT